MSIAQQARCVVEGVMWEQEVVLGKTACQTCHIDELLQPKQPLLAALRYLFLLHQGQTQDAKPIVAMKRSRSKGQADLETVYCPHMLQIFPGASCFSCVFCPRSSPDTIAPLCILHCMVNCQALSDWIRVCWCVLMGKSAMDACALRLSECDTTLLYGKSNVATSVCLRCCVCISRRLP